VANQALFPGFVTRDAAGNLTAVKATFLNFGALEASGVDADLHYRFETPDGVFSPGASLAVVTKFEAALRPGDPLANRLSVATLQDAWAPRVRATGNLGWQSGAFSATLTGRYLSRYLDYQTPVNSNHLGDYWLWDASLRVGVGQLLGLHQPLLEQSDITISAVNAFDRGPQYSNYSSGQIGYDASQFDILGRVISVKLATHW
jgi:hypothetical protein